MKASRALVALSLLTVGASTALTSHPAQAAPAPGKVVVSRVTAASAPVPSGTKVTVAFALTNKKGHRTAPRRASLRLVDSTGRSYGLGAVKVSPLANGVTRRHTAVRTVSGLAAGAYRLKVCFPVAAPVACATTTSASVRIAPAVLSLDDDIVAVPLGGGGGSYPATRVQVTNTGKAPTGALNVAIKELSPLAGPPSRTSARARTAEFEIAGTTCGASLAPGRTCRVDVRRTAASTDASRAVLTVSGARAASASAELVAPIHIEPASYDFGDVAVGDFALHTFNVVNESTEAVTVQNGYLDFVEFSYDLESSFTCVEDGAGPVLVAPGESCTVTVRFGPQSVGEKSDVGVIQTSASNAPFEVSGTGLPGEELPAPRADRSGAWR